VEYLEDRLAPANATVAGALSFPFPTINNISVEWLITGDDDLDAAVAVRYRRQGDTAWSPGMDLRRIPAGSNEGFSWANKFAGSVFDVQANTTYEVQLTLTDPDGGSETRTGTVTTRAVPAPMAGAPVKNATPATLASVLNGALPGDIIELGAGTYAAFTVGRNGLPGQPIVIRDGNGDAVINGPGGAGNAIDLTNRSHVIIDGLRINNGRVKMNGANTVAVVRCTVNASADGIIALTRAENLYIADNRLTGQGQWVESHLGASGFNGGEGIEVVGPGHVIEHNYVKGFRDLISLREGIAGSDQRSIDILDNDLYVGTDDGIEADFSEGNVRVMRNRITNSFMGISSQPSLGGPTYFIRNAMYNVILHAFKLHRGSVGDVGLHNTVVKNGDAFSVYSGITHSRGYFRNNLFIGGPGGVYNTYDNGPGRVTDLAYADATNSFNYDAFGSTGGTFAGEIGSTTFTSLAQLRATTTEANAVQVNLGVFNTAVAYPGSPLAAELAPADLRLRAGSAAENAGQVIPNVNDGFGSTGPDIGAFEFGAAVPAYGPRSVAVATYYVSPTGTDAPTGGSAAAPWRTLQYASDRVRAGDTVIVRAGNYAGFDLRTDGTATAPISFIAEAGARITSRNPRTTDGINLEGADYVVIDGFTVDNAGGTITRAGIRSVTNHHVIIRNNSADRCGTWGILTGFSDDVLIENNVMTRSVDEHGIYVSNSADRPVIRNNTVWGNSGNGIHMNGDASLGGDGIISGALVENNVIYDNGFPAGGSGINGDGVQSSVFRNNLLYDNHASGISLYRIDGGGPSTNNVVVNNTVVMASNGRWALNIQSGSTGNQVFNNVLLNLHSFRGSIDISADSLPGFVSDYNVVMNRFTTNGGSTVQTLAQWRSATGQDAHSVVATPDQVFANFAGGDYRPKAGGPAVDAGTATQAPTRDLAGTARPQGAGFDIGAYERTTATPPAVGSVQVGDGSAQRSMVTRLTVTFNTQVTLGAGAFVVTPAAGGAAVPVSFTSTVVGGVTVATITFTGTTGGSIGDGNWVLRTVASQVHDVASGAAMAADRTDTFHRLYGDVTGDGTVNGADFNPFRVAFGAGVGNPNYRADFDFNGDGVINGADFNEFRLRFGLSI
jgi:parallel beta-helix repeat protein